MVKSKRVKNRNFHFDHKYLTLKSEYFGKSQTHIYHKEVSYKENSVCLCGFQHLNKAGYTANSCGRLGRGGNARFPTFRLNGYGRTDGPTDRQSLL